MSQFQDYIRAASELAALAQVYLDDGAIHTAADCLAEASAKLRLAAAEKDRALDELIARESADG